MKSTNGPIVRDKALLFGAYEGCRLRSFGAPDYPSLQDFGGAQRPNWTGVDPAITGRIQDGLNRYLNPAAFSQPAPFSVGNTPRAVSSLRGPGVSNFDLSLFKNIPLGETARLQVRAEAFNILKLLL